ncbi:IS1 family transposase [Gudongella oleilytica]|jgi:transposase-like protein|uniref:IS1 family transposase n=1 Tax=Gudongella oleilytica TaxID=1582259 RepID=UPI000FF8A096|nr:IS1 family transposase [Gudongella oleilytica]
MSTKSFNEKDLRDIVVGLSFPQVKALLDYYSVNNGVNFDKEINQIITNSHQRKLEEYEINKVCRKCGSVTIVKDGKRADGVQKYLCKDCNSRFTLFSGTILEKTNWHWDAWVKTLEMTINHRPLETMQNVLVEDYGCAGINLKTIWLWRLKLIHALATMETPMLSGIVQIDETFIRESQKGSRKLETYP